MSGKEDDFDSKSDGKEEYFEGKEDKDYSSNPPKITVTSIKVNPVGEADIASFLSIKISFELDRDVVAGYWQIQFLVDSTHKRIIHILGETPVEDYPDGESEMFFSTEEVNISGIAPSTLTNSGLLMALFMVDGEEVASVNMVNYRIFAAVMYCG